MTDFDTVMALITLLADPPAAQARLQELQATIDAAAARRDEADAAHAKLGGERDRLAKLEASLREREVAVFESERRHESALDELRRWKREHTPNRLVTVGPGGLTREADLTEDAPDPIIDLAGSMEKPGPIAAHAGHKAARVSPRRARA